MSFELASIVGSVILLDMFLWLAVKTNEKSIKEGESLFNIFINPISVLFFFVFVFMLPIPFALSYQYALVYNGTVMVGEADISTVITFLDNITYIVTIIQVVLFWFFVLDVVLLINHYIAFRRFKRKGYNGLKEEERLYGD